MEVIEVMVMPALNNFFIQKHHLIRSFIIVNHYLSPNILHVHQEKLIS